MRSPTLHVRLLGGLDLRVGEAPVPPLHSARAESLLAYLLLHRDAPQQRQHLAFLLWPDSTESQARTNLRHVVHNLRRALPEADRFIDVRPRTLQWRPEASLWLDVAAFEQAVTEGRLEDAVETYAGDLLEGCYDEWLLEERERLWQLYVDALERLARQFEEQGRWPETIRNAERLVRADPLREGGHRLLMRVYDASGDRARALRAYHVCAATLQRELGIEPAAATRAAYEALLPVTPEPGTRERAPSPARAPLVGRAPERAQLTALWRAAERGSAQLVLVTGEPGIGKSRLVEELRSWCAYIGAVTAEGRAHAAEGTLAYGLVTSWLRSEQIAAQLRRLDRVHLRELARLLPELLVEAPDLPAPEPLPEDEQRRRLFEAVAASLATGTPLVLVADDVQWSDVETLQFVHYVLRAESHARLMVAATARREEIDAGHPVNELVTALQASGRFSEIGLDRLSREETGVLAERIAGRPLADAEVARLYADSEGNPLFVVEALRADPELAPAAGDAVSSRVEAVIASRLAQLSEPAAELAGVAATIGREFTAEVLAEASGADEQMFVGGLDELWRRGLVRAHGPSAYDFSHGKIREAAYHALSPGQTRHHHLRVAQALERIHRRDVDAVSGQIAAHYDRAGTAREAIAWYEKASEAAQRLHASADAVRFLERALSLAPSLPAGSERAALELRLLTALPAPLVSVEGYLSERVTGVHRRALDLAGRLGVEPDPPLIRSLALANLTRGDFDAARPFGEQLRALAERDDDEVLWVESEYVLGIAAFWQGRLEAARVHFEGAVERYRPEQRTAHLMRYGQDPQVFCLMRLACTLWFLGRGDEAERARDAALALAERAEHPYTLAAAYTWAAVLAVDQRDEERLRMYAQALTSGASEDRPRQIQLGVDMLMGLVDVFDGDVETGIERVRGALDAGRHEPAAPGANGFLMRALLEACAVAGDARAGLAAADEALEMGEGTQLWEAEIRRLRAGFLTMLGAKSEDVETELTRALEVAERQGARAIELRIREDVVQIHAGRH